MVTKGHITNADIRETLGLTKISAVRLLRELVASQLLTGTGKRGVGAMYSSGPRLLSQSQTSTKDAEDDTIASEDETIKP